MPKTIKQKDATFLFKINKEELLEYKKLVNSKNKKIGAEICRFIKNELEKEKRRSPIDLTIYQNKMP